VIASSMYGAACRQCPITRPRVANESFRNMYCIMRVYCRSLMPRASRRAHTNGPLDQMPKLAGKRAFVTLQKLQSKVSFTASAKVRSGAGGVRLPRDRQLGEVSAPAQESQPEGSRCLAWSRLGVREAKLGRGR
jgi:hypothetical protein